MFLLSYQGFKNALIHVTCKLRIILFKFRPFLIVNKVGNRFASVFDTYAGKCTNLQWLVLKQNSHSKSNKNVVLVKRIHEKVKAGYLK